MYYHLSKFSIRPRAMTTLLHWQDSHIWFNPPIQDILHAKLSTRTLMGKHTIFSSQLCCACVCNDLCLQCVGLYVLEYVKRLYVDYIFIIRCAGAPCCCDQKYSSPPDACVGECVRVWLKKYMRLVRFFSLFLSSRENMRRKQDGKDLRIGRADPLNLVAKEASIMVVGPSCIQTSSRH